MTTLEFGALEHRQYRRTRSARRETPNLRWMCLSGYESNFRPVRPEAMSRTVLPFIAPHDVYARVRGARRVAS